MRSLDWMSAGVLLLIGVVGCGSPATSSTPATKQSASTDGKQPKVDAPPSSAVKAAQTARIPAAETDTPEKAVGVFLDAVRRGNDERAAAMFTPIAREKADGMGISVAPKGSDTAAFEIGKAEYLATDGARVASRWIDQGSTDEITWMLRKEQEGWRVAGMATVVFKGEAPLLLDFEQPEDTMRKLEQLRREIERRTQAETAQANQTPAAEAASGIGDTPPREAKRQVLPPQAENLSQTGAPPQATQPPEKSVNPFRR